MEILVGPLLRESASVRLQAFSTEAPFQWSLIPQILSAKNGF